MARIRMKFSGHPDDWPDDEWAEYVAERRRKEEEAAAKAALYIPSTEDIQSAWTHGYHGDNYPDADGTDEEFQRWFSRQLTDAYYQGAEALSDQNAEDRFDGSNTPEFDSPYEEGVTYADWQARFNGS